MSDAFILPDPPQIAYVLPTLRTSALVYAQTRQAAMVYAPVGMTRAEREKLAGIEPYAQRNRPPPQGLVGVPLWDSDNLELSLTTDGSSAPFTMTNAFREVGRGKLLKHALRGSGYIKIVGIGRYVDPAGAGLTAEFRITSATEPAHLWSDNPATRGTPQARIEHDTYSTPNMVGGPTELEVAFEMDVHAAGHTGSTWLNVAKGSLLWGTVAGARLSSRRDYCLPFAVNPLDPTLTKLINLEVRATALGAGQTFKIVATRATLYHPRDGTGYEG